MKTLQIPQIEKADLKKVVTLNGVEFTELMLDKLKSWYRTNLPGDSDPHYFIRDLISIQGYFIKQLNEADAESKQLICRFLTNTSWLIENLEPFTEGGSV